MRKITLEMIIDEDIGMTTETLVEILNRADFEFAFPEGYGKIKASPVFGSQNITVIVQRKDPPKEDWV